MTGKRIARWNGVGRASVAVAGVCLTSSVASAWTTTRPAEFETEFAADKGLEAGKAADGFGAASAATQVLAADAGTTIWEQTLVGYLENLVARDCDDAANDRAKEDDDDTVAKVLDQAEKGAEAGAKDANPDWDLEEPAAVVVGVDPDWDLAEAPVVVAEVNPDWDLEEPAVAAATLGPDWDIEETVTVAKTDPDWDIEETDAVAVAVAVAVNPDWDIEDGADDEAVAAAAREVSDALPKPAVDQNPDWDIEDTTVAAATDDEVTKVDSADEDFDLLP